MPNVQFSSSELDALLFAAAQTRTVPINAKALASGAYKLNALAESEPNSLKTSFGEMIETWSCGSKTYRAHESFIALVVEAILRKRRCRVAYRKPGRSESKSYDFDPYRLLFVDGGLYVIGRVPAHTGAATLAIDRLRSVIHSELEFQIDPEFDPQKCRQDAFGVSQENPIEIVLRFRSDQAPYVRERLWHPSQEIADLPGGKLQLTFRAGGPFEIRRWILGWGDAVEVISPETLRSGSVCLAKSNAVCTVRLTSHGFKVPSRSDRNVVRLAAGIAFRLAGIGSSFSRRITPRCQSSSAPCFGSLKRSKSRLCGFSSGSR